MSSELKRRGFRFVGPTVCYAFMQAVGLVKDHTVGQPRATSEPLRATGRRRCTAAAASIPAAPVDESRRPRRFVGPRPGGTRRPLPRRRRRGSPRQPAGGGDQAGARGFQFGQGPEEHQVVAKPVPTGAEPGAARRRWLTSGRDSAVGDQGQVSTHTAARIRPADPSEATSGRVPRSVPPRTRVPDP
jgi:hypothetical protein